VASFVDELAEQGRRETTGGIAQREGAGMEDLRRRPARRRGGLAVAAVAAFLLLGIGMVAVVGSLGGGFIDGVDPGLPDGALAEPRIVATDDDHTLSVTDQPVDLQLLTVRSWQARNLALIDLDRGEVTVYPRASFGMSRNPIDGGLLIGDRTAVAWSDGVVTVFRDGRDEPLLVYQPAVLINPSWAAPAIQVMPTLDGESLWVVQYTPGIGEDGLDETARGRAELVDIGTREVVTVGDLPPNTSAVAATSGGLILNTSELVETTGGWSDLEGSWTVLELTFDGEVTELTPGQAVAASGAWVAVLTGELRLVNVQTGVQHTISPPVDGRWRRATEPVYATSPDGRILMLLVTGDDEAYLTAVDPDPLSAEPVDVLYRFDVPARRAIWDNAGHRIVLVADFDDPITVLDPRDGTSLTVTDAVPSGYHVLPHP
jgi:hypothetical protein